MTSSIYFPCPALRPYISHYRVWNFKKGSQSAISFRDYPRTMLDIIFLFEGDIQVIINNSLPFSLAKTSCIGQFDKGYSIFPKGQIQLINVRFKPNGIYPLTKIPLKLLVNNQLPLTEVIGKQIDELRQQLQEEITDEGKINLLENYFLNIYQQKELHHKLEYAILLIQQSRGSIAIQTVKEKLQVSYKSLDRWFQQKIGLSPKRFSQLTRFHCIINDLENKNAPDWMQFVVDYHFYDQAHFIKEFKQFAGICPSAYCLQPAQFQNIFPCLTPNKIRSTISNEVVKVEKSV